MVRNTHANRTGPRQILRRAILAAVPFFCGALPAAAQTWTGNVSADWNVAPNWSSNPSLPISGINTALIFGATGAGGANLNQNLASPFILNSLTFTALAPAYIFNSNPLDFRTSSSALPPQIVQNSPSIITFNTPLILTNDLSINGPANGKFNFNGPISGPGGLTLNTSGLYTFNNGSNTYAGTTTIGNAATLQLGIGSAIPSGRNVIVNFGSSFNTAGLSNTSPTAIGALTLNSGAFRIPSGSGNYFLNRLTSNYGNIDFTGSTGATIHFVNPGATMTVSGGGTFTGDGASQFVNDTAGPMDVNVSGSFTSSSVRFGAGASGQGFRLIGPSGTLYLSGTGSTAPLIIDNNAYVGV